MKKRKVNIKRLAIKLLLSAIYIVAITILLVQSFNMFLDSKQIIPLDLVESTNQYSYVNISKMSEKFAYYENENIGLHFVIQEEETGEWHTYVIAIDEDDYDKYKDIIDYSYGKTKEEVEPITAYGYPTIMSDDLKEMILNNVSNFLPKENNVEITEDNLEEYLTNTYLDTTKEKEEGFNTILFITLLLLFIVIALLVFTIFDKDKIVDNISDKIENDK